MTTLDRNSKADTLLYVDLNLSGGYTQDESQYQTNLSAGATWVHETPSARCAVNVPREITITFEAVNTDSGTLINHGDGGATNYTFRVTVSLGTLSIHQGGTLLYTMNLPSVGAATRTFTMQWSTRPRDAAVVSDLWIYNHEDAAFDFAQVDHAASTTNAAWFLQINGYNGATGAYTGGLSAFVRVRIGARYHCPVEPYEDWVAESTPVTPPTDTEVLTQGYPTSLERAAHGQFAGPSYLEGAVANRRNKRRLMSPLLNIVFNETPILTNARLPPAWVTDPPGEEAGVWDMSIARLWHCPSVLGNRAYARAFIWNDNSAEVTPLQIRLYSFNQLPNGIGKVGDEPLKFYFSEIEIEQNDGLSLGNWYAFSGIKLARNKRNETWLALAFAVDKDDTVSPSSQLAHELIFRALTVDPYTVDLAGGDLLDFQIAP